MKRFLILLILCGIVHVFTTDDADEDDINIHTLFEDCDDNDEGCEEGRMLVGPKERRRRILRLQGIANEKKSIEHCWKMFDFCNMDVGYPIKKFIINRRDRPHCLCALEFYMALKKINTYLSNRIGLEYFKTNPTCYRSNYPVIRCYDYDEEFQRCPTYLLNSTQPLMTQYFDLPYYTGVQPGSTRYQ